MNNQYNLAKQMVQKNINILKNIFFIMNYNIGIFINQMA